MLWHANIGTIIIYVVGVYSQIASSLKEKM